MRFCLLLLFMTWNLVAYGQQQPYEGVDSAKGIRWEIFLFSILAEDSSFGRFQKLEYRLDPPEQVEMIYCGESESHYTEYFGSHFRDDPPAQKVDTIYIKNSKDIRIKTDLKTLTSCEYIIDKKHGTELGYYTVEELKGVCIEKNFMLKYQGRWKYGEKNGKWTEFDKTGNITSVKTYKNGQLLKEKKTG